MRATPIIACIALAAVLLPAAVAQVQSGELASIDYASMIGGPLMATVNAQAQAALSTVNFIRTLGFDADNKTINVKFGYTSINATSGATVNHELSVPVLTILPIPYIRVEEMTIKFNAKIQSTTTSEVMASSKVDSSYSGGWGWWIYSGNYHGSYSNQQTQKNSNKEQREFSMEVIVRATQDEMPSGMAKVLDILEEAIATAVAK